MTFQPKRNKWSEAEERTLIDKYGAMDSDGSLSKLKTREKKYVPIALHVNSEHYDRDSALFPFQWTSKDVAIKVQNMRNQYNHVKQKIKRHDDFDWTAGIAHWSNFVRYKEVFGDVSRTSSDRVVEGGTSDGGPGQLLVEGGTSDNGGQLAAELFEGGSNVTQLFVDGIEGGGPGQLLVDMIEGGTSQLVMDGIEGGVHAGEFFEGGSDVTQLFVDGIEGGGPGQLLVDMIEGGTSQLVMDGIEDGGHARELFEGGNDGFVDGIEGVRHAGELFEGGTDGFVDGIEGGSDVGAGQISLDRDWEEDFLGIRSFLDNQAGQVRSAMEVEHERQRRIETENEERKRKRGEEEWEERLERRFSDWERRMDDCLGMLRIFTAQILIEKKERLELEMRINEKLSRILNQQQKFSSILSRTGHN